MDYFESGVFTDGLAAWHGMGVIRDEECLTTEQALMYAELDWTVSLRTMGSLDPMTGEYREVPGYYASTRDSDGAVFGVVGKRYTPMQNRDAFAFADTLLGTNAAKVKAAVSLYGGQRVCLTLSVGESLMIGGEEVLPYVVLSNDHGGTRSLMACCTPIRVVCANTEAMALGGAPRVWKGRHTASLADRGDEAARFLGLATHYFAEWEATANGLLGTKLSDKAFEAFLASLLPLPEGTEADSRKAAERDKVADAIAALYRNAENLGNIRGTAWGAYNAVTEYADHGRRLNDSDSTDKLSRLFDRQTSQDPLKDRALAILTA